MTKFFKPQITDIDYYQKDKYDSVERFITYYYQIFLAKKLACKNILEIGIGNGLVSNYLNNSGAQVTTCDFDQANNPDVVADVRQIPLGDGAFDLVMACQVLEHVPFEDFPKILKEFYRLSTKYVIISLPVRSSYFEIVLRLPFVRSLFHRNFLDFYFRKLLNFAGFDSSGQHYWEIDRKKYTFAMIRNAVQEKFHIISEFSPVLNKYHYFLILEKK